MWRLALIAFVAWLIPTAAVARFYEVFIDIETEEELYDLFADGAISEGTLNTLLELLQRGVDINRENRDELYTLPNLTYQDVDRILQYRDEVGFITEPRILVAAGVLSEAKFDAIEPFLIVSREKPKKTDVDGHVRIEGRLTGKYDRYPPATAIQADVRMLRNLEIGLVGILRRNRVLDVRYDASRDALSATTAAPRPVVPKFFVEWNDDKWAIIGGTYRIGFGQRLTFDATDQITPHGFYGDIQFRRETELTLKCKESAGELPASPCDTPDLDGVRVTPDYKWTNRLAGIAVALKDLAVGRGSLDFYAWGSYQPNSIFQTETVDASKCPNPFDNTNPNCSSVPVYVRRDDPIEPTSAFIQQTLSGAYAEALGGGNLTYHFDSRSHIGITGYGAAVNWLINGIDLDFQDFARTPFGGAYGAVGLNGAYGFAFQDFFFEVSRSFDSQRDGGGGYGGLLRSVTNAHRTEIEISLRYYGKKFNNPYARPISAADQVGGLRARDEAGIRIQSNSLLVDRLNLRLSGNVWRAPSETIYEGEFFARTDLDITKKVQWSLWGTYRNKDFSRNGRGECFEGTESQDPILGGILCAGEKIFAATQLRGSPNKKIQVTAHYQHAWRDDRKYDDKFRQDLAATLTIMGEPTKALRIRLRARYFYEDIIDSGSKEHVLWNYLEALYTFKNRHQLRARYDLRIWLDDRVSTELRRPNPEHWLWVEYNARF